jgi:hypothetical protein
MSITANSPETSHWVFDSSSDTRVKNFCSDQSLLFYQEIEAVGIYRSMNKAIEMINQSITSDPFVLFLHSGDELVCKKSLSDWNKELLHENSWFYTDYEVFDPKSELVKVVRPKEWSIMRQLFVIKPIHHQALFIRLSTLKKYHGFDLAYEVGADWDLLCRISLKEKGTYISQNTTKFSLGGYSSVNRRLGNRELKLLRDRHLPQKLVLKLISYLFYQYRLARIMILESVLNRSHFLLTFTRRIARWK